VLRSDYATSSVEQNALVASLLPAVTSDATEQKAFTVVLPKVRPHTP
jgi:hypothetical protein